MVQLQKNQNEEGILKLLNDLKLQFEKELWALKPELAVIEAILNKHPEIYELVQQDITRGKEDNPLCRKDIPTVEEIVRAAIYKEMKNLTYQELEYEQHVVPTKEHADFIFQMNCCPVDIYVFLPFETMQPLLLSASF